MIFGKRANRTDDFPSPQKNGTGYIQKNKVGRLPHTINQNLLKINHRSNVRAKTMKLAGNLRAKLYNLGSQMNGSLDMTPKA